MRTRIGLVTGTLTLVLLLATGCADGMGYGAKRTMEPTNLDKAFHIYQRVEVGGGWAVLTEPIDGVRTVGFATVSGRTAAELGQRYPLPGALEADMTVQQGLVVVEWKKNGAPQYEAFQPGPDGLVRVDYYERHAPHPPVSAGQAVVVNKRENALWHFVDGELVKVYRVATGRQTALPAPTWQDYTTNFFTPEGTFVVTDYRVNPPYYALKPGDRSFDGGAPGNPLGTRWMGFAVLPGDGAGIWGIHGTAEPEKIGTWASDGCIRMYTEQVEELFDSLHGQQVTLEIRGE